MNEDDFKKVAIEYLEAARQSGKSETSGLVSAIFKMFNDITKQQFRLREYIYLFMIFSMLVVYAFSFWYVFSTKITRTDVRDIVYEVLDNYELEIVE